VSSVPYSQEVTIWSGGYPLARDDPFFDRARFVGQKYVDEKARGRLKSEVEFRAEMVGLREAAHTDGAVLLDELEHRWSRPDAPPSLYVLTMKVSVAANELLVAGGKKLGRRCKSIKVGQARRSLAPRLWVYAGPYGLRGAKVVPGSLVLRAVVYGGGRSALLAERELQRHSRSTCLPLWVEDDQDGRWRVTSESYLDGENLVEGILDFARADLEQNGHA
jgi:hypothetical protein